MTGAVLADRPLDLHWGILDVGGHGQTSGCPRARDEHRLISDGGKVVRVRCKGPNVCLYCRKLATIETVETLMLDAMEDAPTIGVVLTAREHLTRRDTYEHLNQLRRAIRRHWPQAQWFVQVEFQLRGALHLNLLVKHVPAAEVDRFRAIAVAIWCKRVDARPSGQWCRAFSASEGGAEGFVRYVAKIMAHGLKASQAPPLGWRGHRTSQTRGYFVRPVAEMRAEARASLLIKRELWKALESGLTAHDAELAAHESAARAAAEGWSFVSTYMIATEEGWAELGVRMTERDDPAAVDDCTWETLDDLVLDVGTCDEARDEHGALLDRAEQLLARWS
jgi:hypothetical protein